MQTDDKKTRLLALALTTLIFMVSMTALVYWAVNVASARINSKVFVHMDSQNPLVTSATVAQLLEIGARLGLNDESVSCQLS